MITIRKGSDRGHANHGWLDSHHTFSFGSYRDPNHQRFRDLRVINEDRVEAGKGFGEHPHDNMEILSYVLSGELEHKDSMGNGSVIKPGEFQRLYAGTGITHSEFNHSKEKVVHFYQIWIVPNAKDLQPEYDQRYFSPEQKRNKLTLVASPDARNSSMQINQDVCIYSTILDTEKELSQNLNVNRHTWIQVLTGKIELGGVSCSSGDGISLSEESHLKIVALAPDTELLVFDLA